MSRTLSANQRLALSIVAESGKIAPSDFVRKFWPGDTSRSRFVRAAAYLGGLKASGLVREVDPGEPQKAPEGCKPLIVGRTWELTDLARELLKGDELCAIPTKTTSGGPN
jgi:hypothetical protein